MSGGHASSSHFRTETYGNVHFYGYGNGHPITGGGGGGFDYVSATMVSGVDPDGTHPIPIDGKRFADLYELSRTTPTMRIAMDVIKRCLFTYPFDVTMGRNRNNGLNDDMKENIITEKWLPQLLKMHDWLVVFGFCPYVIRKFKRDLNSSEYASKATADGASSTNTPTTDTEGGKKGEKDKNNKKKKKEKGDGKSAKTTSKGDEDGGKDGVGGGDNGKASTAKTSPESHRYIYVPSVEMGYTYTYLDKEMNQKLLWVWNPCFLPNSFKKERSTKGYTDPEVLFVVRYMPTVIGGLTCPLSNVLRQYDYLKDRRCAELSSLKGYFNPVLFFEKEDKTKVLTKSPADEFNANYANAYNTDMSGLESHLRMKDPATAAFLASGGRITADGRVIMPDGRTGSLNVSGTGGLAEAGITSRSVAGKSLLRSDQSLGFLPQGNGGLPPTASMDFVEFDPGTGVEGYEGGSGLKGTKATSIMDPELNDPMSGVSFRVKRLLDGEKVVELKNGTEALLDKTSASELEYRFNKDIGFIIGYPIELISASLATSSKGGSSGGGGGGSSGGGSSSSTGKSSGGGGGGGSSGEAKAATGGLQSAREYSIESMKPWKVFYEAELAKIFTLCYAKSIERSKMNVMQRLEREEWYVLKAVYDFKVTLVVTYPPAGFEETIAYMKNGVIEEEEFLEINRSRLGMNLDDLKNPVFMKKSKEKLSSLHDEKYKMKMATDSAIKLQDHKKDGDLELAAVKTAATASGGGGAKKKRKKEGSGGGGGGGKSKKKKEK